MTKSGRRWVMAERPGAVLSLNQFELREFALPDLGNGDVFVKIQAHTVEPGARAAMMYASFGRPMVPGDPMLGMALGTVVESRHPRFQVNDMVTGFLGWATHAVVRGEELTVLDPKLYGDDLPPEAALGPLGISGLTAYVGMFEVGRIKAGETVLVSSAAGSVGYLAGQMAVIAGCDVVGIAGSDAKCQELVDRFGFHGAINHRSANDLAQAIKSIRPDGVDVFFDNVGGRTLNAGAASVRPFGRVVMCGRLGNYAEGEAQVSAGLGPSDRVTFQGFVVSDYAAAHPTARRRIANWLRTGKLIRQVAVVQGIEQSAAMFLSLFESGAQPRVTIRVE